MHLLPPQFVVFGGSFNPVHSGHLSIARQLAAMDDISQVLIVPARTSPFKFHAPMLPADLRYQMVRAATAGLAKVAVLDWEITHPGPSYTVYTAAALRGLYPSARLWIAMGTDVFHEFSAWHQAETLLDIAGLLVFSRSGPMARGGRARPAADALPASWKNQLEPDAIGNLTTPDGRRMVWHVPIDVPEISSSAIWESRDLTPIPEPARALLAGIWQTT